MTLVADGGPPLYVADDDFVRPWRPHGAVVLQHGFCRNGGFWAPWVPHLGHDFRVLRPDLRGCGNSADPGPDCQLSLDDYVGDLFRVLDHLGIDSAHYVGEATGAFIGMAAAAREPGRIRSLNLFNTPSGADARTRQVFAMGHPSWADAVRQLGVEGWWRQAGAAGSAARSGDATRRPASGAPASGGAPDQSVAPGGGAAPDELAAADHYAREVGKTPVHVAVAMLTLSSGLDVAALLGGVRVPTRFITTARYSFNTSRDQTESLASRVPGAVVKEFDVRNRGGLYCFYDAETIAPEVAAFLRAIDRPPT